MARRLMVLLCGVAMCVGLLSCRKISDDTSADLLKSEPIKSIDAIPAEYGNLVSVTQWSPETALLWFERPDKTIVIVGLQAKGTRVALARNVALIPRGAK